MLLPHSAGSGGARQFLPNTFPCQLRIGVCDFDAGGGIALLHSRQHRGTAAGKGVQDVATRLQSGDIFICSGCTDCIREFGLYRWDEKAPMDRPIKENDHAMDDVRYFVHKIFGPQLFSF